MTSRLLLAALCAACIIALVPASPGHACATCACSDPALVGAGGARPSEGRARVGAEVRWFTISSDVPVDTETRAFRVAVLADATIIDGVAIDAMVPIVGARRDTFDKAAYDGGFADADVSVRAVVLRDREIAPSAYGGLRGGVSLPLSALGRDPRGSRLDTGTWIPHAEMFGAWLRGAWFVSAALGARLPLAERIGEHDLMRGPSATAAVRGQLQPRPDVGVFLALSGEVTSHAQMAGAIVEASGGSRALVTSGVSFIAFEDVLVELAATAPLWQSQPESLDGMLVLTTTFDVGRR